MSNLLSYQSGVLDGRAFERALAAGEPSLIGLYGGRVASLDPDDPALIAVSASDLVRWLKRDEVSS